MMLITTTPMLRRSSILLFALFTYFWSASCLGELLLIQQLSSGHDGSMQLAADDGRELVFHHAGHQDSHEPSAIDAHTDDGEHHDDHVVALGCEQSSSPSLAKDFKLGDRLLAPPALLFITVLAEPLRAPAVDYPTPRLRNSLPELIRSQRLLV